MRVKRVRHMILGYGAGYIGQGSTYNFLSAYFVLFLTNCVGISASVASMIASVALIAEVVAGMLVGNLSDNCTLKMGRRRPFLLIAAIAMPVISVAIMRTLPNDGAGTVIYYLILSILFRITFSTFEIPNNALGAEIAKGYDERTKLRTIARAFSIAGNAVGYIMPVFILNIFSDNQEKGWLISGIILAVITFVSWTCAVIFTKEDTESNMHSEKDASKRSRFNILENYLQLCKISSMKYLIIYKATFTCAFALFNVATIFYMKYCLGLSGDYSMYIWIFTILIYIVMTPITNKTALKIGKTGQQKTVMAAGSIAGILIYFAAPCNFVAGIIYIGFFSIVQTSFWQLSSSIFYDMVEVDEYLNGKRREGDIMSLVSVLGTLITALIVQVFGIFLDMVGYSAELSVQNASVINYINAFYILVPSICFGMGYFALKAFPLNKERFIALQEALELKRKGESYDCNILK